VARGTLALVVVAAFLVATPARGQPTFTWTGFGVLSNWSDIFNWEFLLPPTCTMGLARVRFGDTNGGHSPRSDVPCDLESLQFSGPSGYVHSGSELWIKSQILTSGGTSNIISNHLHFYAGGGAGTVPYEIENGSFGPLALSGTIETSASLDVRAVGDVWLSNETYGSGPICKLGPDTLVLGGANTYQGGTFIVEGTLVTTHDDVIPPGTVTMQGGTLDLTGNQETIGPGNVATDGLRLLTTHGPVAVHSPTFPLRISTLGDFIRFSGGFPAALTGLLELATTSGTRNVDVADSPTLSDELTISAAISNSIGTPGSNPALRKSGEGRLVLSAANTFGRDVHVAGGVLKVTHPQALGQTGAGNETVALSQGTLELAPDLSILGERLWLFGAGAGGNGNLRSLGGSSLWSGPVTLTFAQCIVKVDAGDLELSGVIADAGPAGAPLKLGAGRLVLSGNNSFRGETQVWQGVLQVAHRMGLGAIGGQGTRVSSGATLEIAAGLEAIEDALWLAGSGVGGAGALVSLGGDNLRNAPVTFTAPAAIAVAGGTLTMLPGAEPTAIGDGGAGHGLEKLGPGRLVLSTPNDYSGPTTVSAGVLEAYNQVYDTASVAVVRNGATLAGAFPLFGTLTVETGGTLAPGLSGDATVALSVGSATFQSGSLLQVDLGGTTRGGNYDGFTVTGHAVLDGTLQVSLVDGFVPALGDAFLLVSFGSSSGTFAGLQMPVLPSGLGWQLTTEPSGSVWATVSNTVDVEPHAPTVSLLRAASPNPSSRRTLLGYDLARAGRIHLRIFDVRGRAVATVVDGEPREPGRYDAWWAGQDDDGRPVPAGIYFARLALEGREVGPVRRVVRAR
jgi:autotransporter-associated beta strand protein